MKASQLLTGGQNGLPMSVNDIFSLINEDLQSPAGIVTRAFELLYKPGRHSSQFINELEGPFHNDAGLTLPTLADSDPKGGPSEGFIGFAWRNIPAGVGLLNIRTVKIVEWEPRVGVGMQQEEAASSRADIVEAVAAAIPAARARNKMGRAFGHAVHAAGGAVAQAGGQAARHVGRRAREHFGRRAREELGRLALGGAEALAIGAFGGA